MTIRDDMAYLRARVRLRIGDPAGATQVFDEQTIQDALDEEQLRINISDWRELVPHYSVVGSPPVWTWTEYYDPSNWGDWEPDVVLYTAGLVALTPTTSEPLIGHWSFAPTQTPPPVFIVGKTFDVAAAARSLVLRWLAIEARSFDFAPERGVTFSVSQKRAGLQQLADQLATEMRIRTAHLVRHDVFGR